jgi:DNA repair protein RecO (recombination protein O)
MRTYKDEAIVIRSYKLGESDRILALLTSQHGLKRAVAKGIRRTISKFGGRLEAFTHANILFHRGKNLDIIAQVEVINSHAHLRENFAKYLFGEAILEVAMHSIHEGQHIPQLFDALKTTLECLEEEVASLELFLAAYELKICALIGYRPRLVDCTQCGRRLDDEAGYLSLQDGGVMCSACAPLQGYLSLERDLLTLAEQLLRTPMEEVRKLAAPLEQSREALSLSFSLIEYFLERPIKSHQVIAQNLNTRR